MDIEEMLNSYTQPMVDMIQDFDSLLKKWHMKYSLNEEEMKSLSLSVLDVANRICEAKREELGL